VKHIKGKCWCTKSGGYPQIASSKQDRSTRVSKCAIMEVRRPTKKKMRKKSPRELEERRKITRKQRGSAFERKNVLKGQVRRGAAGEGENSNTAHNVLGQRGEKRKRRSTAGQ